MLQPFLFVWILCGIGASIADLNSSFLILLNSVSFYDGVYYPVDSPSSENNTGLTGWKTDCSFRLSVRFPYVIVNFYNEKDLYSAFLPASYYDPKKNDFSFNLKDVSYPLRLFSSYLPTKTKKTIKVSYMTVSKKGSVTILLSGYDNKDGSRVSSTSFVFQKQLSAFSSHSTNPNSSSASASASALLSSSSFLFNEINNNLCTEQNIFNGYWKYDKNQILTEAENWQHCPALRGVRNPDDPRQTRIDRDYQLPFFYRDSSCYVIPLHLSLVLYYFLEEQQIVTVNKTPIQRLLINDGRDGKQFRYRSQDSSNLNSFRLDSPLQSTRLTQQQQAKQLRKAQLRLQQQQESLEYRKIEVQKNLLIIEELLKASNSWFATYKYSIPFISICGDSLSNQIRDISICEMERITRLPYSPTFDETVPHSFYNFTWHPYLRHDLPCHSKCRIDKSFYERFVSVIKEPYDFKHGHHYALHNSCYGCYHVDKFLSGGGSGSVNFSVNGETVIETPQLPPSFLFSWLFKDKDILKPNGKTKVLILSTGAWYGAFNSVENCTKQLNLTIQLLFPLLKDIQIRKKDLLIFWLSMPPMVKELTEELESKYEWKTYSYKSQLIHDAVMKHNIEMAELEKNLQHNSGVIVPRMYFLDLELFGKERKLYEHQKQGLYDSDHLHWINSGPYSVPAYILEAIFHLYIRYRLISQNLVVS
jgi:ferritin-like protein